MGNYWEISTLHILLCSGFAIASLAFPLYAMATGEDPNVSSEGVSVQCLTQNKKVIPLSWQCGQLWTTNVKLPDLLLINRGPIPVTPCALDVVGMAEGREVAINRVAEDFGRFVKNVNAQFKQVLGDGVLENVFDPRRATGLGVTGFAGTRLSATDTVNSGESAVVLLSHVLFFTYTGLAKIDDLRITLTVQQGAEQRTIPCPIRFTPYESKGNYIFPVKGNLCITSLPMNTAQHRPALSQEFAIDILASNLLNEGQFSGAPNPNPKTLADYPIYHREVMAIGNGRVVEVGDKFPESLMSNPATYSEKQYEELIAKLAPEIGFLPCVAGNYIVIDHENGEFSAYCHLSEGSIRVKTGDRVAQGDIIAAVGNTGHSTEPHLHFQLMDSKDFLTANGLPIMFRNIPPTTINQNCKSANSLLATDYIMLHVDK